MNQDLIRTVPAPDAKGATLHLTLDKVEHERRLYVAAPPILNPAALDVLLSLPVGMPVPIGALPWGRQRTVRQLLRGAAYVTRTHVTRHAVRPCRIDLATVSGDPTRRNLERATRFAPFCARTLIIPRMPRREDFLMEADFWGVGVALGHGDDQETLVEPRRWVLRRHTPAGWRYVERAYKAATTTVVAEAT
jgi:hypothetical protein